MAKIVSTFRESKVASDAENAVQSAKSTSVLATGFGVVLILALIGISLFLVFAAMNS